MTSPIEASAQDSLDDEVICRSRRTNTNSDVDLPIRRGIKIGHDKELLLLLMEGIECTEATVVRIVFNPPLTTRVKS
jgi:hypothetical protein